jgi:hypothetical protein
MCPLIQKQHVKYKIMPGESSARLNEASIIYGLTENRQNKHITTKLHREIYKPVQINN